MRTDEDPPHESLKLTQKKLKKVSVKHSKRFLKHSFPKHPSFVLDV